MHDPSPSATERIGTIANEPEAPETELTQRRRLAGARRKQPEMTRDIRIAAPKFAFDESVMTREELILETASRRA